MTRVGLKVDDSLVPVSLTRKTTTPKKGRTSFERISSRDDRTVTEGGLSKTTVSIFNPPSRLEVPVNLSMSFWGNG